MSELDLLIKLRQVQKIASSVSLIQAGPEDIMNVVTALGSSVSSEDAGRFLQLAKVLSDDPNESLASFFTRGGFVKIFGAANNGVPQTEFIRCPHCGELVAV